jgi:hypothetical protein
MTTGKTVDELARLLNEALAALMRDESWGAWGPIVRTKRGITNWDVEFEPSRELRAHERRQLIGIKQRLKFRHHLI